MVVDNLKASILVVEDDPSIVKLLVHTLERQGYVVRSTKDGEEALLMIDESKPDLILLDWMLPGLTGVQICDRLKKRDETKKIPIIMISARGEEADRIDGLNRGVDDYLVKPFSPRELLARINALFRRSRPAFVEKELTFGDIYMNLVTKQVVIHGKETHLGPIEYKLLQSLLEHPRRVLSREQLIRRIWGDELSVESRTVDVHVNRLRKALELRNCPTVIKTIRSSGYCLKNLNDPVNIDLRNQESVKLDDLEDIGDMGEPN